MHIEAIDLFYLALPRIERTADGTQDSLLVRVTADDGTVGWGECDASPLVSLAAYVMPDSHANIVNIREALLGQPIDGPDDVRRAHARAMRMALDVEQIDHALAGADIALWDLVGRALGEPVWRVLGHERSHPKLPYASVLFGEDPAATEHEARRLRGEGFRAAKFGWGPMGKGTLEDDVALVAAARRGLGTGPKLMVDAGVAWAEDDAAAAERAVRFAEHDVTWLEEPLGPGAVDAYARLAARGLPVAIAAGEGCDTYRAADDLMCNGRIDYCQIDAGRIGGITVAHQVCRRADALGIRYVNHTFKSHLSLAAAMHVFAGDEGFDLVEYPAGSSPLVTGLTRPGGIFRDAEGLVRAPDAPGLGVEVNTDTVREYLRTVQITVDGEVLFESGAP